MDKSRQTMRPMAIRPECYPCLERLVGIAVELATPDPEVRRQALKSARSPSGPGVCPGRHPRGHRQPAPGHHPSLLREP